MDIKPIETIYKGYRFRSRLEARWAVFFDNMGIKWLYEHEGYVLENGEYYLPDFFLPDLIFNPALNEDLIEGVFFEIKGEYVDAWESFMINDHPCFMISGGIPHKSFLEINDGSGLAIKHTDMDKCISDTGYALGECRSCNKLQIVYGGWYNRGNCYCGDDEEGKAQYIPDSESIKAAFIAARSARFEYGENGV